MCVFTSVATDLAIDVTGPLSDSSFLPLPTPKRIANSLVGGRTDDGQQQAFGRLAGGTQRLIPVSGRVGLPGVDQFAGSPTVVFTIVAVNPSANGYLTIHPCAATRPKTSSLNYTKGVTIANTVIARPSSSTSIGSPICVYTQRGHRHRRGRLRQHRLRRPARLSGAWVRCASTAG